ncbi:hypothetical protein INS49_000906 [Diaporthe citri]|uniref:uncharacterized protein n=1 Tax=Diaporthe citri TaxID=83186 RepID=UPI001C823C73|nr:uncharacterized protein INS49_000906 [Diaporthe citri]KAG6366726.1 hypothetical protein INS49_000906 [Diaporthe citri]
MGLGSKIKEALHGDHHDKTSSDARPPGAFPQDDIPQKHADGKDYIAPHGSLIDKNRNTTGHAGTTTGTTGTTGSGLGSTPVGGADSLSAGAQRNKLHKEGEGYLPSETGQTTSTSTHGTRGHQPVDSGVGLAQTSGRDHTKEGAYWGDLSPGGHASKDTHGPNNDLPEHGHHGHDYTPVGTGQNVSSLPDRTTHGHGSGSAAHHNPLHGDQAVGGGVYNTVAGAGSPDYDRSHGGAKPHTTAGTVHDPLTSGTRGTNVHDYKTSLGGAGAPTSRDDRTTGPGLTHAGDVGAGYGAGASERGLGQGGLSQGGLGGASHGGLTGGGLGGSGLGGNGLSGSGVGRSTGYGDSGLTHHDQSTGHGNSHAGAGLAGAGVAVAAGYGASELSHRGQGSTGHGGAYDSTSGQHAPGVPRTSMLDVEPAGGVTGSHPGHTTQSSGIPHSNPLGSQRGVTGSPPHHGSHGVGAGSPTNVGSGIGTHSNKETNAQAVPSKPALPPNVSIFSPKDPSGSKAVLNGHIFSRLTTSSQTEPSRLAAALKASSGVSEAFCLSHGGAVLVFDAEQPGVDLKDSHHEHVRAVCLALKDADISLSISGCVFDAAEVVKAGFQLDGLSRGAVMVVDLMHEEDDDSGSGDDEDAEAILMGGDSGEVVS